MISGAQKGLEWLAQDPEVRAALAKIPREAMASAPPAPRVPGGKRELLNRQRGWAARKLVTAAHLVLSRRDQADFPDACKKLRAAVEAMEALRP